MLMPAISVTLIGIVAAAAAAVKWQRPFFVSVTLGFVGAWAGFMLGALVGVVIDVLFSTGIFVALIGHAAAVAGAFFAVKIKVRVPKQKAKRKK
jgi:uncharacterized membrane protein YeaQ/YmgE (transglycosylase-associated protein family)